MNDALKTALARKSDQELLEMVLIEAHTYRPDAVEAAREELESRGVPLDSSLIEEDSDEPKMGEAAANLGRSAVWKVLVARELWLTVGATVAVWLFLGRVFGPVGFYGFGPSSISYSAHT